MRQVKQETLHIRNKLPQIILPQNKIDMFIEWYNKDLRFQDTIPKAFTEGYIFLKNDIVNIDINNYKDYIKQLAKQLNATYRQIEVRLSDFINCLSDVIIYFVYSDDNVIIKTYTNDSEVKSILSKVSFKVGHNTDDYYNEVNRYITKMKDWDDLLYQFHYLVIVLFSTCMWYLATSTKQTKYYYEKYIPREFKENKEVKKVPRYKTISTPIYDMNKIRRVKVEGLVKQRKGWTYSHSFQVHGHYRHYKDGKVVFVKSYIKGKNKDIKNQVITLNPKS